MSVTGMGAVIRRGGPAEALASLPADETVDLPYDQRDQVMFGPDFTRTAAGIEAAHASYAPVPVRELIQAPQVAGRAAAGRGAAHPGAGA